jgi:hypothetical protein
VVYFGAAGGISWGVTYFEIAIERLGRGTAEVEFLDTDVPDVEYILPHEVCEFP